MDQKFAQAEEAKEQVPTPEGEDTGTASQVVSNNTTIAEAHDSHISNETEPDKVTCPEVAQDTNTEKCKEIPIVIATGEVEDVRVEKSAAEVGEQDPGVVAVAWKRAEVECGLKEDCAEREGNEETLTTEGINQLRQEPLLANETKSDPTLEHARELAKLQREGYHENNSLIYRTRQGITGNR